MKRCLDSGIGWKNLSWSLSSTNATVATLRPTENPAVKHKFQLVLFFLLLAITGVYANHFHNSFHFDDFHTVVDNPSIRSLRNVPSFFTDATTFSVLPANRTYRPVVSASLAFDYFLAHGYTPFWFHLTTFLFFLALVALIGAFYRVILDRTRPSPANAWLALFGAAWFGLHPAMAETVNYVIQRGDLYCAFGCVAALYFFARFKRQRRTGLYLLPLVFALLAKPPAAVFPALLFLYVFFFEAEGKSNRAADSLLAAFPAMTLTALLLWLQSAMTPHTFLPSIISPWVYRLTQPYVWLRYTLDLILPFHLNVDTDLTPLTAFDSRAIEGVAFLILLLAAILWTGRLQRLRPLSFGLSWFLITQLPTSLYPLSEVENDHRMFLSFVGLILAAVWAGALLAERIPSLAKPPKPILTGLAILALMPYAYGTYLRNQVWRSEETLWLDDIQKSPHNGRGLMIYGLTQMNKGAFAAALDCFERASVYTPNYPTLEINLGIVNGVMADLGDRARAVEAERHFLRAIALAPADDATHGFYGRWLSDHGRYQEAVTEFRTAVDLNPSRAMQHDLLVQAFSKVSGSQAPAAVTSASLINRSLTLNQEGHFNESTSTALAALRLDPHSAIAWNNIAANNEALHHWDAAIDAARHALSLQPDLQIAKNNLAWSLSQKTLAQKSGSPLLRTAKDERPLH